MLVDSTWVGLPSRGLQTVVPDNPMKFKLEHQWEPGGKYRLTILPGSLRDVYGLTNDTIRHNSTPRSSTNIQPLRFQCAGT